MKTAKSSTITWVRALFHATPLVTIPAATNQIQPRTHMSAHTRTRAKRHAATNQIQPHTHMSAHARTRAKRHGPTSHRNMHIRRKDLTHQKHLSACRCSPLCLLPCMSFSVQVVNASCTQPLRTLTSMRRSSIYTRARARVLANRLLTAYVPFRSGCNHL